jgi:type III secretion protein N (ATPase)
MTAASTLGAAPNWAASLKGAAASCPGPERLGRVVSAVGTIIEVTGLNAKVGDVCEFLDEFRSLGLLQRSIVVVATSDRSSAERAKAPEVAMACAEYFRDQGQSVLLLMDSVTRCARALREIGLAAGEPPTRRGYPHSVFNALPRLFERAGCSDRGAITAFFTVLVDDDAAGDPIFGETRATLDGHILLSPRLADGGHYPAIDVLASRSRVMQKVTAPEHAAAARKLRELMQIRQDIETLVQMGEYRPGSDAVADRALSVKEDSHRPRFTIGASVSPNNLPVEEWVHPQVSTKFNFYGHCILSSPH